MNLIKLEDKYWINPNTIATIKPLQKSTNKFMCSRISFVNGDSIELNCSPDVAALAIKKEVDKLYAIY